MWEILGLPAHPLLVHLTVVAAPLIALLTIGYAVVPRLRGWALAPLAIGAVVVSVSAFVTQQAGEALLASRGAMTEQLAAHEQLGEQVFRVSLVQLGTVALLLLTTVSGWADRPGIARLQQLGWLRGVAIVAAIITSVIMLVLVVLAGHSGSTSVWG